ncbi:hypothetical protein SIID45300_01504 [Candidatus Magnetaquicoccaceae bacterium FCR-1]|uniref:Uncharacterized protein n=1 Tax=Candidatus Magnetaquiglobus chichijimensis TaxID=3141448 RepID=A0ABQ0C8G6_9PROT
MNIDRPIDPVPGTPFTDNPVQHPFALPSLPAAPIDAVMPEPIPGPVA